MGTAGPFGAIKNVHVHLCWTQVGDMTFLQHPPQGVYVSCGAVFSSGSNGYQELTGRMWTKENPSIMWVPLIQTGQCANRMVSSFDCKESHLERNGEGRLPCARKGPLHPRRSWLSGGSGCQLLFSMRRSLRIGQR